MEALFLVLFFPPVMGYLATTKGYHFWTWFVIGFFLPVISLFILFFLKEKPIVIDPSKLVVHEQNYKVLWKKEE
jgi:hypothetical protein